MGRRKKKSASKASKAAAPAASSETGKIASTVPTSQRGVLGHPEAENKPRRYLSPWPVTRGPDPIPSLGTLGAMRPEYKTLATQLQEDTLFYIADHVIPQWEAGEFMVGKRAKHFRALISIVDVGKPMSVVALEHGHRNERRDGIAPFLTAAVYEHMCAEQYRPFSIACESAAYGVMKSELEPYIVEHMYVVSQKARPEMMVGLVEQVTQPLEVDLAREPCSLCGCGPGKPQLHATGCTLCTAMTRVPGMTRDIARGAFRVFCDFYRAKPWKLLHLNHVLRIDVPWVKGWKYAQVIGGDGTCDFGIYMPKAERSIQRYAWTDADADNNHHVLSLSSGAGTGLSFHQIEYLKDIGAEVVDGTLEDPESCLAMSVERVFRRPGKSQGCWPNLEELSFIHAVAQAIRIVIEDGHLVPVENALYGSFRELHELDVTITLPEALPVTPGAKAPKNRNVRVRFPFSSTARLSLKQAAVIVDERRPPQYRRKPRYTDDEESRFLAAAQLASHGREFMNIEKFEWASKAFRAALELYPHSRVIWSDPGVYFDVLQAAEKWLKCSRDCDVEEGMDRWDVAQRLVPRMLLVGGVEEVCYWTERALLYQHIKMWREARAVCSCMMGIMSTRCDPSVGALIGPVAALDDMTAEWTKRAMEVDVRETTAPFEGVVGAKAIVDENFLIVIGGRMSDDGSPLDHFYRLELELSDNHHVCYKMMKRPLETPLYGHTAVLRGGEIWLYGGKGLNGNSGPALDEFKVLNVRSLHWRCVRVTDGVHPPGQELFGHTACVWDDCMIVYGGWNSPHEMAVDVWMYHFHDNAWTRLRCSGTSFPRAFHCAWIWDDRMYVHGGEELREGCDKPTTRCDVSFIDLLDGKWQMCDSNFDVAPGEGCMHAAVLVGDVTYFYGGRMYLSDEIKPAYATGVYLVMDNLMKTPRPSERRGGEYFTGGQDIFSRYCHDMVYWEQGRRLLVVGGVANNGSGDAVVPAILYFKPPASYEQRKRRHGPVQACQASTDAPPRKCALCGEENGLKLCNECRAIYYCSYTCYRFDQHECSRGYMEIRIQDPAYHR